MAAYTKEQNRMVTKIKKLAMLEYGGYLSPSESLELYELRELAKKQNICWW